MPLSSAVWLWPRFHVVLASGSILASTGMIAASAVAAAVAREYDPPRRVKAAVRFIAVVGVPCGGICAAIASLVLPFEVYGGTVSSAAALTAGIGILICSVAAAVVMVEPRLAVTVGLVASAAALTVGLCASVIARLALSHGGLFGIIVGIDLLVGAGGAFLAAVAALMRSRPRLVGRVVSGNLPETGS